jgi:hypothetical protein
VAIPRFITQRLHLVHLTKPLNVAPADQSAPEVEERLVDVGPPLVAHLQPPVAVQPRKRPLHDPPVSPQLLARLYAAPGDAALDAPLPERLPAAGKVVALVGVQLLRALPRPRPRGRRIGAIVSMTSSSALESWTLAAVWITASGTPRRSTTRWRFEPRLPRSVGFGPVFLPPRGRARSPSPRTPSTSRPGRPRPGGRAMPRAAAPTPRLRATPAACASRSCRCRTPSPGGASPRGCRS